MSKAILLLQKDCTSCVVPHVSIFQLDVPNQCRGWNFILKDTYNQTLNNHLCVVGVVVARRRSFLIVLKTVTSIEEFGNVSSKIDIQHKLTTGMVVSKFSDIKHHLIQNDQLFAVLNLLIELFWRVVGQIVLEFVFKVVREELLVPDLHNQKGHHD